MSRFILYASLVFALLAWILPGEIVKWQLAAARNQLITGDFENANATLKRLAEDAPENNLILFQRINGLAVAKDAQTIRELEEQLTGKAQNEKDLARAFSMAFHEVGQHQDAYKYLALSYTDKIRKSQESVDLSDWEVGELNNLGYFAYLAGKDTQLWHRWLDLRLQVREEVNFAIFRAEALRLVGEPERSAKILEAQLDLLESEKQQKLIRWKKDLNQWMSHRDWPTEEPDNLINQRINLINLQVQISRVGKQGWTSTEGTENLKLRERFRKAKLMDSAAPSLEQASEDDFSTIEFFAYVDSPKMVCQQLRGLTQLFDTRACLAMANNDYPQALEDLDNCIEAITLVRALSDSVDLWNTSDNVDVKRIELARQQLQESWAIIYYHRIQLKEKLGDTEVDLDRQRIRELGFDPDAELY